MGLQAWLWYLRPYKKEQVIKERQGKRDRLAREGEKDRNKIQLKLRARRQLHN